MAVYTPLKLWAQAAERIDKQGPSVATFGVYCLGALAGLLGLRWCVMMILSYA